MTWMLPGDIRNTGTHWTISPPGASRSWQTWKKSRE